MLKKIIAVILLLALCTGLCACDVKIGSLLGNSMNGTASENPIVGTWEVKGDNLEASFTFAEGKNGVEGAYKYYDYAKGNWGEFAFTVKEQTEHKLVLLI